MQLLIYFFIFISKLIENAVATLRLIVVANGKKLLGAILNLITSLAWIVSTSLVILNIKEDLFKVVVYAIGCFIGSYLGSFIEEKIAIGSNMLFVITKPDIASKIKEKLDSCDFTNSLLKNEKETILIIMVSRKRRSEVLNIVRKMDNEAIIISENAHQLIFK